MRAAMSVMVRRYAEGDAALVRALADEAFSEYDGNDRSSGSHAIALTKAARTHTLVAERDGRAVGYVMLAVENGGAHIVAIAVERGARGRGIGARLLGAAERLAWQLGARVVALETGEANLAALDMFIRAGYRVEGRIARYYRTGYDALTLRRELDAI